MDAASSFALVVCKYFVILLGCYKLTLRIVALPDLYSGFCNPLVPKNLNHSSTNGTKPLGNSICALLTDKIDQRKSLPINVYFLILP